MTKIEEQFTIDILPFGVIQDDGKVVYARFKMQLVPTGKEVIIPSVSELTRLFAYFNKTNWKYHIDKTGANVNLTVSFHPNGDNPVGIPLRFVYKDVSTGRDIDDVINDAPWFGNALKQGSSKKSLELIDTKNDEANHMFGFLNHIVKDPANKLINFTDTLFNLEKPTKSLIDIANDNSSHNLQPLGVDLSAKLNDVEVSGRNKTTEKLFLALDPDNKDGDFKAFLGSIYEETELAERLFGLVREFRIPMEEIEQEDLKKAYTIHFVNKDPNISVDKKEGKIAQEILFSAFKREVNGKMKYYNGLKDPFICENDNFFQIATQLVDPYKVNLVNREKKDKEPDMKGISPDGIYVLAKFQQDERNCEINPFDISDVNSLILSEDKKKKYYKMLGSRGFNVVVKSYHIESGVTECKSLTRHSTTYQLNRKRFPQAGQWNISTTSLGYLEGNSRIQEKDSSQLYNNLLFAWRGDNLNVNKSAPDEPVKDATEPAQNKSKVVAQSYQNETDYLHDHVIQSKKGLLPGSNAQLANGTEYSFFLRIVNGLEYTIPISSELCEKTESYLYTLDDHLSIASDNPVLEIKNNFDLEYVNKLNQQVSMLPIKSPVVIGKRAFNFHEERTDYKMDQHTHLILDKYGSFDRSESRQIYAPEMKWEDFKISGYLLKYSLRELDPHELTKRAVQLDKRSREKIPADNDCSSINNHKIKYIADPRASFLVIYPANAASINKIRPAVFKAFEFGKSFPYYENNGKAIQSVELQVKRTSDSKNTIQVKTPSNEALWSDQLPNGMFAFQVYSQDKQSLPEISNNGSVNVQVSCIARPPKPLFDIVHPDREENFANRKNWWWAVLKSKHFLGEHEAWRSLKFQEVTKVLKLKNEGLDKLMQKRDHLITMPLLLDEYPYDLFVEEEGSFGENASLQTQIYNQGFKLEIDIAQNLYDICTYFGDYNILQIAFNDKDKLLVKMESLELFSGFKIYFNGVPVEGINSTGKLSVEVFLNEDNGVPRYSVVFGKTEYNWLNENEFLSPEFSIHDVILSKALVYSINTNPKIEFNFESNPDYAFIVNEKSPYAKEKVLRLFASSPYQAYFKKEEKEFSLGVLGDEMKLNVPNNEEPAKPEVKSGLLFYDIESEKHKIQTKTKRHLVRLVLQEDFMLEGRNKLGIIVGKRHEPANPDLEKIPFSDFGEDITKLDSENVNNALIHNLKDYIDLSDNREPVLAKYYDAQSLKWYRRKNDTICYHVLECTPYYNSKDKVWQVVLTFHDFDQIETTFFKLFTMKICKGHGLESYNDEGISVLHDKTGTILSRVSNPIEMPLYTRKTVELERTQDGFEIRLSGPSAYKEKIIGVFQTKRSLIHNEREAKELIGTVLGDVSNYEPIRIMENKANSSFPFLLSEHQEVLSLPKLKGSTLIVMEFEKHTNFNPSEPIGKEWKGKHENPLFDKDLMGLRLINTSLFDI